MEREGFGERMRLERKKREEEEGGAPKLHLGIP